MRFLIGFLGYGDFEQNSGSHVFMRFYGDSTSVLLDNFLCNRQAQSGVIGPFCGKKHVEDLIQVIGGYTRTVIGDFNENQVVMRVHGGIDIHLSGPR